MSIRVAIVEDEAAVRENLAVLIDSAPGFQCVSSVPTARQALVELPAASPEVVLMDILLPGMSGVECVRALKRVLPATQFIMLTNVEDAARVFQSLRAGAVGYVLKNLPTPTILEAIAEVHKGGSSLSSQIARLLVRAFHAPPPSDASQAALTARELEILALIARGYRSKEVASDLGISVATVNTHVRNIYEKLQVRSRVEAVTRVFGN